MIEKEMLRLAALMDAFRSCMDDFGLVDMLFHGP